VQHSYVAILRTPHARPLVLASLVGRLSSGMGPLALVLFVQDATGSFANAGAASAATATRAAATSMSSIRPVAGS